MEWILEMCAFSPPNDAVAMYPLKEANLFGTFIYPANFMPTSQLFLASVTQETLNKLWLLWSCFLIFHEVSTQSRYKRVCTLYYCVDLTFLRACSTKNISHLTFHIQDILYWWWQIILLIFTSHCFCMDLSSIKFFMIRRWLFFTSFLMEDLRSFSLQTLMSIVIIVVRFSKVFLIRILAARVRGLTPRPLHLLQVLLHLVLHHAPKLLDTNLSLGRMSKFIIFQENCKWTNVNKCRQKRKMKNLNKQII